MLSSDVCMGSFYTHTPFLRLLAWQANTDPPTLAEVIEQPNKHKAFHYNDEYGGHGSYNSTSVCTVGFYKHETCSGLLGRDRVQCHPVMRWEGNG